MSGAPPVLWAPDEARIERADDHALRALARGDRAASDEGYHDLWRWSVDRARGVLGLDLGLLRRAAVGSRTSACSAARDARRASGSPARGSTTPSTSSATGSPRRVAIRHASELRPLARDDLGRARDATRRVRRRRCARSGSGPATASSRTCRTSSRPSSRSSRARASARSGRAARPTSARAASSTASRRSSRGCCSPSTATATAGATTTGSTSSRALQEAMPSLERRRPALPRRRSPRSARSRARPRWDDFARRGRREALAFAQRRLRPSAVGPLQLGTTGLPKAIVHGHGGILLEHLKKLHLHLDLQARRPLLLVHDDRLDDVELPRRRAADRRVDRALRRQPRPPRPRRALGPRRGGGHHVLRTSAQLRRRLHEGRRRAARAAATSSRLAAVGSTGSPLRPRASTGSTTQLGAGPLARSRSRGGTDVCTAFVGGVPTLPVYRGELQAARSARGRGVDPDGRAASSTRSASSSSRSRCRRCRSASGATTTASRYRASYFDTYPGVWRHGDWIELTDRGTAIITGRSDATINRGGIRMGTAEIYRAVLALDEVVDALVVDLPREGTQGYMPLFVVLRDGVDARRGARRPASATRIRERLLAAPRARRDPRDRRGAAHALGQDARGAGEADPQRRAGRHRAEPRLARQPRRAPSLRGARRDPRVEETHDLRRRRRPLRADAVPPHRAQRAEAAGDLARALAQLRRRPAARDEPRDRPARVRPRRSRTSTSRTTTGRPTARPRRRSAGCCATDLAPVPRRARRLDEGRLRHVARPVRRVGLAEVPAREPRPEPRAAWGSTTSTSSTRTGSTPRRRSRRRWARSTRPSARARRSTRDLVLLARADARGGRDPRRLGTPLLIHQPSYSMLNRWIEDGLLDALGELGVGCIGFSPLAQGLLTDRYVGRHPRGLADRRATSRSRRDQLTEQTLAKVRGARRDRRAAAGRRSPRWRSRGRCATRG